MVVVVVVLVVVVVVDGRTLSLWDSSDWRSRSRSGRDDLGRDGLVTWRSYWDILFLEHGVFLYVYVM